MAGIYIPGMEMPENCGVCRFAVDGWCYAYGKPNIDALSNSGKTNWCPLIPVPDHGRLIDADALVLKGYALSVIRSGSYGTFRIDVPLIDTDAAPTIIPAVPGRKDLKGE